MIEFTNLPRRQGKLVDDVPGAEGKIRGDQQEGEFVVSADQIDSMVQSILERNRREAKRIQDKAMVLGAVITVGAFELVVGLGLVHFPSQTVGGYNLYRLAAAAVCGALGGAIGKWIVRRPKA